MATSRTVTIAAAIVLACASSACHDPNAYLLTPDNVNVYLTLTSSAPSVAADGISRITLTASIDPNATTGNRTITFSTSAGTLIASGKTSTTDLAVEVDSTGKALVELRPTTAVVTCRVTAAIKGLVRTLDIPFTVPNADDVLVLAVSPTTVPADGFSRARITATLKLLADPAQRTVQFKTSAGTLFASPPVTNGGKTVDVSVDATGVAFVDLQSSNTLETAFVSATAANVTKNVSVGFTAPASGSIISIAATPSSAPADGASLVQIVATIAAGIPADRRTVTFTATDNVIANGTGSSPGKDATVTPDAGNHAVIDLKAPTTPGSVRVTATVNGVSTNVLVNFTVALPDSIFVSPARATIQNTDTDAIQARLLRNIGTASANQIVTYGATDASGVETGSFDLVQLSTVNGGLAVSSATYVPAVGAPPGVITIRVSVGTVTGTATIRIIP